MIQMNYCNKQHQIYSHFFQVLTRKCRIYFCPQRRHCSFEAKKLHLERVPPEGDTRSVLKIVPFIGKQIWKRLLWKPFLGKGGVYSFLLSNSAIISGTLWESNVITTSLFCCPIDMSCCR